jgi:hypothetical protein
MLPRYAVAVIACCALATSVAKSDTQALFYLDIAGRVLRADVDGGRQVVLVKDLGMGPDGIALDVPARHIYWTSMGRANADDGTIMRADFDGKNLTTIVPAGGTFTPKQLKIDGEHRKLYWSDREGMRVMRSNLDGSHIETLIVTGNGDVDRQDQSRWCVGIALDVRGGKIYWTQKGADNAHQGTIKRAGLEIPNGEDPAHRTDIEVLFAGLPEPIDLELDLARRTMYWTDRGDNTISRAPMDPKRKPRRTEQPFDPFKRTDREILVTGLDEAIGIALDLRHKRMFYTALRGHLGTAKLNGRKPRILLEKQGTLTGIAIADF